MKIDYIRTSSRCPRCQNICMRVIPNKWSREESKPKLMYCSNHNPSRLYFYAWNAEPFEPLVLEKDEYESGRANYSGSDFNEFLKELMRKHKKKCIATEIKLRREDELRRLRRFHRGQGR